MVDTDDSILGRQLQLSRLGVEAQIPPGFVRFLFGSDFFVVAEPLGQKKTWFFIIIEMLRLKNTMIYFVVVPFGGVAIS